MKHKKSRRNKKNRHMKKTRYEEVEDEGMMDDGWRRSREKEKAQEVEIAY
ncbi:hypothetical protein HYW74_00835 [Candidatus Pacearchaeota archaeon]|nr:hypothetical protein [Candidatus Pacearchaeota archaeon]